MAVVPFEVVRNAIEGAAVTIVRWANLNAGDTGQPYVVGLYSDKTIQTDGSTLGSGITIEGTIDPREVDSQDGAVLGIGWNTLNDPQGNSLGGIIDQRLEEILEHCYAIRPNCAAGVSGANVYMMLSSTR